MKKKGLIILIAVAVVLVVLISSVASSYNGFVDKQETVNKAQSNIEIQLQRRADLIPNFVETVKGYSDYEQSTFTAVTEARSAVTKAVDGGDVAAQAEASAQLDSAIDIWVNAVTEAYPELKADKQYLALQDELAGTENRIAVARKDYNEVVQQYNVSIRKFPSNIIAGIFGFDKAELFEADESAQKAPTVDFS
ncbi:MAG: LemA family protein [Clostridia bacterium]|nr:LemA family protein [Clostridia bacterium]